MAQAGELNTDGIPSAASQSAASQSAASQSAASRSVGRSLAVMQAVADAIAAGASGISLTDVAKAVELSTSTALRHLRSLEATRFVERQPNGVYAPGPELLRLARSVTATVPLARSIEPLLRELSAVTGESAYLAEPVDEDWAVYTASAESAHAIRHVSWLGQRVPRSATAVGAALHGDVDPAGVAVVRNAVEDGVTAISAPLRRGDRIVAAISIIGPSFRLDDTAIDVAARRLTALIRDEPP